MQLNPNKYLRGEILRVLEPFGLPVFDKAVPITEEVDDYVLVHSQTMNEYENAKFCNEWLCSIVVDIRFKSPLGVNRSELSEDYEALAIDAIRDTVAAKHVALEGSQDLTFDGKTHTYNRKVLTFSAWLA